MDTRYKVGHGVAQLDAFDQLRDPNLTEGFARAYRGQAKRTPFDVEKLQTEILHGMTLVAHDLLERLSELTGVRPKEILFEIRHNWEVIDELERGLEGPEGDEDT
jgi:hypothetical protein